MENYDIVVVGGGPAGATFAKFIDKRYKVLLLEKRDWGNPDNKAKKVCGGLLNERAQRLLAEYGYVIPLSVYTEPQVHKVKVVDIDNNIKKDYYKNYINVDREKFDEYMLSQAAPNVTVVKGAMFHKFVMLEKHKYQVDYRLNGQMISVTTKVIVGADGANSMIDREINPNEQPLYTCIQKIYGAGATLKSHYAIFDKDVNDYYSWIIPKGDKVILGTVVEKDKNPQEKMEILESKFKKKENLFGKLIEQEGTFVRRVGKTPGFHGGKNVPLIGEAGGFISPSSLEGISYAIETGHLLATCMSKHGRVHGAREYYKACKKLDRLISLKSLKGKLMYTKWLRAIGLKLGIGK